MPTSDHQRFALLLFLFLFLFSTTTLECFTNETAGGEDLEQVQVVARRLPIVLLLAVGLRWASLQKSTTDITKPMHAHHRQAHAYWVCLSVCLSVCLFVCLFVCLSVCVSLCLYLSVSLCLCLS
eukprot:SAG31_NODE_16846_length_693_cov_1.170034_1_plen_123_part_10